MMPPVMFKMPACSKHLMGRKAARSRRQDRLGGSRGGRNLAAGRAFARWNVNGCLMDRLSLYLTLIVGALVTGGLVTAVLSMGWYSWTAIGGAAACGVLLTWPVSYGVSRRIKTQDPDWDETRVERVEGVIPDPKAPEV